MQARIGTLLARVGLTTVVLGGVIVLGQIPWGDSGDEAVLRVALRTVRGKLEVCRELDAAEQAALPQHMRGQKDCDVHPITYRLRTSVDGEPILDELVEPGGMRRDRPHNVDREIVLAPGTADVEVLFEPELPDDASAEMVAAFSELRSYELSRPLELAADRITLVYLDDTSGDLGVLGPGSD